MEINPEIQKEIDAHVNLLRKTMEIDDPLERLIRQSAELRYLVCHGQGNGWLLKQFSLEKFRVSEKINLLRQNLHTFAYGIASIPELVYDDVAEFDSEMITLVDLMKRPCFYYKADDGTLNVLTWDELVSLVANKYGGAHSDIVRKRFIREAQRYEVGNQTTIAFLLDVFSKFIIKEVYSQEVPLPNVLIGTSLCNVINGYPAPEMNIVRLREGVEIPLMKYNSTIPDYIV